MKVKLNNNTSYHHNNIYYLLRSADIPYYVGETLTKQGVKAFTAVWLRKSFCGMTLHHLVIGSRCFEGK